MNEIVAKADGPAGAAEVRVLAREMAAANRDRVARYKHELGLSSQEAAAKAEEPCSLQRTWAIEDCPPEQVTWGDLDELNRASPERALLRWEGIKRAALDELRCGDQEAAA